MGQLVDAYDDKLKIWAVAQIIHKKDDQIKIHWYGWHDRCDEWINKNDTKIAALQTHTFPMIPLIYSRFLDFTSSTLLSFNSCIINPRCNIKYDIKTGEWCKMVENESYLDLLRKNQMGFTIHHKSTLFCVKLHKIGNVYQLDLNTATFKQHKESSQCDLSGFEIPTICKLTGDEIHLIDPSKHYVYNINTQQWKFNGTHSILYSSGIVAKFIYIESMEMFIAFINVYHDDKRYFVSYQYKHSEPDWVQNEALSSIHIDFDKNQGDIVEVINILDHLLLITFYGKHKETKMMIFDLLTSEWFACNKTLPVDGKGHIVDTKDNYIHFMGKFNTPSQSGYHYKMHLMNIIPFELDQYYRDNKYNKLIFGFSKEMEQHNDLWCNFPYYLKTLILKYYPCFLY